MRRILNVPKRGIGLTSIGRVQDYADMMNLSFYDALRVVEEVPSIGRAAGKINDFVSFIQGLKSKAEPIQSVKPWKRLLSLPVM